MDNTRSSIITIVLQYNAADRFFIARHHNFLEGDKIIDERALILDGCLRNVLAYLENVLPLHVENKTSRARVAIGGCGVDLTKDYGINIEE